MTVGVVSGRRWLPLVLAVAVVLGALAFLAAPAGAADAGTSRSEAVEQLDTVRLSINKTLALFKDGRRAAAITESRRGYLDHFERVEIPLRLADPELTLTAEQTFAELRNLIDSHASSGEVRDKVVDLRDLVDRAERKLTSPGLTAPLLVAGQSFLIIFREGLEAVLLLSALLGYLAAAKAQQYRRPILWGVALAVAATGATIFLLQALLAVAPVGRELLEAITAIVAVVLLFWVSFWLISRLEHKRWMEFLQSRVWTAISLGSTASLVLIGFTAVYREGFETVLFYQALLTFGAGLGVWIAVGFALGVVALAACSWAIFKLGRRVPIKTYLMIAVTLVMVTSVAFLGNAVASLQSADVVGYDRLYGWPRLPIFLAEATGYRPTLQTVSAQVALIAVYVLGAAWVFVVQPRLARGGSPTAEPKTHDDVVIAEERVELGSHS